MRPEIPVIALARAKVEDEFATQSCLKFVRTRYGEGDVPSGNAVPAFNFAPADGLISFAAQAWENTEEKHRSKPPPVGVPVWWTGGPSGHVAISAGRGFCISTDWPSAGKVGRVSIKKLTERWNKKYRGWSEDINKVHVFRVPVVRLDQLVDAAVSDSRAGNGATTPAAVKDVRIVNGALYVEGLLGDRHAFSKSFTHRSVNAYRKWQILVGSPRTPTGVPDKRSLTRLGRRYGFTVE